MSDRPFQFNDTVGGPTILKGGRTQEVEILSDAEIVERTIDFTEKMGMYLEPWQAAALRAILLHGGDVAVVRGGRGY